MLRYFFDLRDGTDLILDDEGAMLRDMVAVQREAAKALSGLAGDSMAASKSSQAHQMAIEVRDGNGLVMKVECSYKITRRQ